MHFDLYTKGILTVIAVALIVIAFRPEPIAKAIAQSGGIFEVRLTVKNDPVAGVATESFKIQLGNK